MRDRSELPDDELIVVVDTAGELVHLTPAFTRALGWDAEALVGSHPPFPWWPPGQRELLGEAFRAVLSGRVDVLGSEPHRLVVQRSNGRRLGVDVTYRPWVGPGGRRGYAFFHSVVCDHGPSEERLQAIATSFERLRDDLQALGIPLATWPRPIPYQELDRLSPREREVLHLLRVGLRSSEIAEALHISPHTARNHVRAVFRKLGVHSHIGLLVKVQQLPEDR